MSGRKSEDDIRKYLPDLDAVLRTADPEAAKERRRQALAELKGEHGEEIDEAAIPPSAGASPWANAGAAEIDRSALPSALAPGVVPPVTTPIKKEGSEERRRGGAFPGWLKGVAAVLGVLGPLVVLLLLQNLPSSKTNDRGDGPSAALTSTGTGAAPSPMVAKSAATSGAAPAESATATMAASADSAPPPAPEVSSTAAMVKPKIKNDDPYDAAPPPSLPKTNAPLAPPAPTVKPSAEPPAPPVKTSEPPPAASAPDPFLRKRPQ